jgi:hypothetical protein
VAPGVLRRDQTALEVDDGEQWNFGAPYLTHCIT